MKNTLSILLLTLLCFGTLSAQTWTQQISAVSGTLNSVSFIDATHGATGGNSSPNLSFSNGATWYTSSSTCTDMIVSVQSINSNTIYAASNSYLASFYRSTNGGSSFNCARFPIIGGSYGDDFYPNQIFFLDSLNGYVCGLYSGTDAGGTTTVYGQILKTTDGGISWQQCLVPNYNSGGVPPQPNIHSILSIYFLNTLNGFALGNNDSLYKTMDGGLTWQNYNLFNGGYSPNYIYFQNASTGWATANNGILLQTTTGGMSWPRVLTQTDNFTKILFTDSLNGWLLGTSTIYHSCDGGATWAVSGTFNNRIHDISMVNNSLGYAVGDSGYIYKFSCPATTTNIIRSICSGDSFSLGKQSFNATGHYSANLTASNCGCDSIVNLDLTVNPLPIPTVNYSGGVFITGTYAHYQWLYNGVAVTGDTLQSVSPSFVGDYSVLVTDASGCSDTSVSTVYTSIETVGSNAPNISLYPNPATQSCSILIHGASSEAYDAQLIDMTGKEVSSLFTNQTFDKGSFTFPVSQYAKGIYMLKVTNSSGQHVVKKLVVE